MNHLCKVVRSENQKWDDRLVVCSLFWYRLWLWSSNLGSNLTKSSWTHLWHWLMQCLITLFSSYSTSTFGGWRPGKQAGMSCFPYVKVILNALRASWLNNRCLCWWLQKLVVKFNESDNVSSFANCGFFKWELEENFCFGLQFSR